MSGLKIGTRVVTAHGCGTIVNIEHFSRIGGGTDRYGVKLDKSPFSFEVAWCWPKEIAVEKSASDE